MSTFLSINMLTPETRIYLDPPLNQVKEIQMLDSHIPKVVADKPLYLMCDLIESKSSYSNRIPRGGNVELNLSQLLAVIPSQKYPCLRVSQTKNPVNYFTLLILDEAGRKAKFNSNEHIRIHLKISC